jgi:hypothetical protein
MKSISIKALTQKSLLILTEPSDSLSFFQALDWQLELASWHMQPTSIFRFLLDLLLQSCQQSLIGLE